MRTATLAAAAVWYVQGMAARFTARRAKPPCD